ncbi:PTS fructose transporter subunit IIC [Marinilactibacillus psychrotolerans]|uniref:Fructose-specific PTS system transporter subunit IIC n=1 Tax=Marinilactibacillus psychrotolerans TaxID=191770 RepID=A0AAV3WRR8_9LACT|nr:PTS fructose transporter subunit IIC [Marinilactibacillus psychrotolerans]GEL67112.1 PTS fructose transporter subunit IIC [Marinilactibacillus psychrotolerans]GEQ35475.1 fructose-specific PTS system transporter subunit IIC [Marinilactibacillus psychrotolerans]SDC87327.1 PTS system, fructose-specific IIC component [Marinilactibacillus psychrotolerans]
MAKSKNFTVIKNHILTGISYMLPLIVGAGVCMALGQVIGRLIGAETLEIEGSLPWVLVQIGAWGLGLIVPVIAAAIAYSIADKPGIAPGVIIGFIANQIEAGFIGGILGGFLVGYLVRAIMKYIKVPKSLQGLMPVMIIPLLSITISGLIMYFVIGGPIAYLQNSLIGFLESMQGGSQFLFGGILGSMATFDFGGPVNKTMSMFADGLLVEGVYGPEAVKFVGSIIPPFGITISYFLTKNKYTKSEKESLKAAFPMGIAMITEGVIPIAARDLIKVVGSCVLGSFVAGGLIMTWGVEAPVPHGGLFVVPLFTNPWLFMAALGIGSVITGVTLSLWKKQVTEEDEAFDEMESNSVDDDAIVFTVEG